MTNERLARLVIDDVRPFVGRTFRLTARDGQVFEPAVGARTEHALGDRCALHLFDR